MWDIIDTDFGGSETVNFGPRLETGTALYQVDTIATVSCQDEVNTHVPPTVASVRGDYTCLAVDKMLMLQSSSLLGLDHVIEEMDYSPDGSVVIVGVTEGYLYVLDAKSTEIVHSMHLVPADKQVDGRSFRRITFSGDKDLVILTANGQLIVQSDTELFQQEPAEIEATIGSTIYLKAIGSQHTVVYDMVVAKDYIYTLGGSDIIISKWCYGNGCIELDDEVESMFMNDAAVIAGTGTTDGHYLFTLDSNHILAIWDTCTMLCVIQFTDMHISCMRLLENNTSQNNSLQDMKLIVLKDLQDGVCNLMVQSLPSWETVYQLQLCAPCTLAKCDTFQDSVFIQEFCPSSENPQVISMLRFRCLSETDPKTRLYRILQKNRFEEAEMFAKLYQLDIELVRMVKANHLLDQLSPNYVAKYDPQQVETMVTQLWSVLDMIQDDIQIAETGMRVALPSYASTKTLLKHCQTRLTKASDTKDASVKDRLQMLTRKLLELQHRLLTFKLSYGEDKFTGEKWQRFMGTNLLQEAASLLDSGQLRTGFLIWVRHQAEWTSDMLSRDLIQQAMSVIPRHTPTHEVLGYITSGLIPTVIRAIPQSLDLIVDFVIGRAKDMEKSDKTNWPSCAIQFADFVYQNLQDVATVVLDEETYMAQDHSNKVKLRCEAQLLSLEELIVRLRQLDEVLHKYKCRLTLAQFLKETRETIAFRMLDKVVAPELIASTLDSQIRPYMKEHGLNQDQIFSRYIKDLLDRHGQDRSYTAEAAWESKASTILEYISDPEQKIEGILEVMKWAPIPWSPGVDHLVQLGLAIKHSMVYQLKEQCDKVQMRKLMMKYGLKSMSIPQGHDAKRLMEFMISQDKPGGMEDALEVMKACGMSSDRLVQDLHQYRMRELILAHRLEEALDMLRGLPTELGLKIAQSPLMQATVRLDDWKVEYWEVALPGLEDKVHEEQRLFTEAGIHMAKYLQQKVTDHSLVKHYKEDERMMRNLLALQMEFDLYLTTEQYKNEQYTTELVLSYLQKFLTNKKQGTGYTKIYRLAQLLRVSHTTIQGQLAIKLAKSGDIDNAVKICGELYESSPTAQTARTLYEVVQALLLLMSEVVDSDVDTDRLRQLPTVCGELASQALIICEPESLAQFVELSKTCQLLVSVNKECESGEATFSTQWGESGMPVTEKDWEMFGDFANDMFWEDGSLLNSAVALPLVSQYAVQDPLLSFNDDSEDKGKVDHSGNSNSADLNDMESNSADRDSSSAMQVFCQRAVPVIQHLRQSGHIQLAFAFSTHMLYTNLQYTQRQCLGFPIHSKEQAESVRANVKVYETISKSSQSLVKELIFNVVQKIFNSSRVDGPLALTYFLTQSSRDSKDWLMKITKMVGHQYKKLRAVAEIGVALGEISQETSMIEKCRLLQKSATWGYKLTKMKIPCKEVILDNQAGTRLLPLIARSDSASTELVKEFCREFQLDQEEGLLLYLDHLFVVPEDVVLDHCQNSARAVSRAKEVINEITNVDNLQRLIRKIFYRSSPYDYETLQFALETMKTLELEEENIPVEKGLQLLEYLRVYTRNSPPSEYEIEYKPSGDKKESQLLMGSLPEESKRRLPLHPLLQGEKNKIVTPELKKETFAPWLQISKLLKLSSDQLCMTTIQNMVRVYTDTFPGLDRGSDMSQWHWRPEQANRVLMQDAADVIKQMENCETSLACGKWMVSKLPRGSEKVCVLEQCINMAELWHQSLPEESSKKGMAKAAYLKFLGHWRKLASAQALCLHGLGEADLLQHVENPSLLIEKLYEHPSITECGGIRPDIHSAAKRIADIHNVALNNIQTSLLQKWLHPNITGAGDMDVTMTFNLEELNSIDETKDTEDTNFKRIVYLVETGRKFSLLIDFAFQQPTEGRDTLCCIRSLRCVLYICDEETLQMVGQTREGIRQRLHTMIYLASLEKLHVRHTVESFNACEKEGLIKGIWRNHSHQKTAATLVSCFCLEYQIYDQQLWTGVLKKLHMYGLFRQLEYVLGRVSTVPELWQVPSLPTVWLALVTNTLSKVSVPLSQDQLNRCVHYFNLIISCPVLQLIDINSLIKHFQRLELSACHLWCLMINSTSADQTVQSFLTQNASAILTNLVNARLSGLNNAVCQQVREEVYDHILTGDRYEIILGTQHQADFVSFCVQNKSIDSLLVFAIQHNRMKEAETLFGVYCKRYPEITLKLAPYLGVEENVNDTFSALKAYLAMQDILDDTFSMQEYRDIHRLMNLCKDDNMA